MSTQSHSELRPNTKRVVRQQFTNRLKTSIAVTLGLVVLGVVSSAIATGVSSVTNVESLLGVGGVTVLVFIAVYVAVLYAITRDSTVVFKDNTVTTYRVNGELFFIDETGTTPSMYKPVKYTNDRDTITAHDGVVILHDYPVTVKSGNIYHTTYGYMGKSIKDVSLNTAAVLVTRIPEHDSPVPV